MGSTYGITNRNLINIRPILIMETQKVLISVETFQVVSEKVEGKEAYFLTGTALPFGKVSRNRCTYNTDRAKERAHTLDGVPFLYNHSAEQVGNIKGHVVSHEITEEGIRFKVDLDPEEKEFIRKVERSDIKHVSIGATIEDMKQEKDAEVPEFFIGEFIELSAAPVPGFLDARMDREGYITMESFMEKAKPNKYLKGVNSSMGDDDEQKAFQEGVKKSMESVEEDVAALKEEVTGIKEDIKAIKDKMGGGDETLEKLKTLEKKITVIDEAIKTAQEAQANGSQGTPKKFEAQEAFKTFSGGVF